MKALADSTVAVVGLGLMGGSLALALQERRACARVFGIERDAETRALALDHGIPSTLELGAVTEADVIVLATPVRTILEQLPRVGETARAGTLVMDIGSTKREIVRAMNELPSHLDVIGGHPMCGKERAGFANACASMFANAVFVLTPLARTRPEIIAGCQSLVRAIGAEAQLLDAGRHDEIAATISHLPYAAAATLMLIASERARQDDLTFALAAGGFRDTSRVAASDVTMMVDILLTNREPVGSLMRAYAARLAAIAVMVEQGQGGELSRLLTAAMGQRRRLDTPGKPSHD